MPEYLSTDPNAGEYLSSDPMAGMEEPLPSRMNQQELRPGKAESFWESAKRKLSEALFGTPERQELKEAGIAGLQPTTAEMAEAGARGAGAMAAGAGMGMAAGYAPTVLKFARPLIGSAVGENLGRRVGGQRGATIGAIAGGLAAGNVGSLARVLPGRVGQVARIASGALEANAAKAAGAAATGGVSSGVATAEAAANEMARKIVTLRRQGLSGAQIEGYLLKAYRGARPSEIKDAVGRVLGPNLKKGFEGVKATITPETAARVQQSRPGLAPKSWLTPPKGSTSAMVKELVESGRVGSKAAPKVAAFTEDEAKQNIRQLWGQGHTKFQIADALKDTLGITKEAGMKLVEKALR